MKNKMARQLDEILKYAPPPQYRQPWVGRKWVSKINKHIIVTILETSSIYTVNFMFGGVAHQERTLVFNKNYKPLNEEDNYEVI